MHHIFAYNRLPWGASAPRVTFLEIPHRADVNIWLTCNAATYLSRYSLLEGQHFGFWESPGGTAPKRGADTSGTHMYHHAKLMQKCKTFMYSYCITVVCPRLLTVGDSVVLFFFSFIYFFLFNFVRCPCDVSDVIVSSSSVHCYLLTYLLAAVHNAFCISVLRFSLWFLSLFWNPPLSLRSLTQSRFRFFVHESFTIMSTTCHHVAEKAPK